MKFQLHTRLSEDCFDVGRLVLSRVLMMNDRQFPWFILVPERPDIREIHQLDVADREQLMRESCALAETLTELYQPDKLNIAAIGNLVPQLHLHHVVRFQNDKAWPAPIWGKFAAEPYQETEAQFQIERVKRHLNIGSS
ncbi:MAG: hypothetical protein RL563_1195 [Pseudomonadota bacterium]|jgi:diadenosine tetraphosphate (Ap4A) HIT family hydrolase